jgi:hypothetical protein
MVKYSKSKSRKSKSRKSKSRKNKYRKTQKKIGGGKETIMEEANRHEKERLGMSNKERKDKENTIKRTFNEIHKKQLKELNKIYGENPK